MAGDSLAKDLRRPDVRELPLATNSDGPFGAADDKIILSELSEDELVRQMHDDLCDGLKEEIKDPFWSAAGRLTEGPRPP
jgi:hypothetical protein